MPIRLKEPSAKRSTLVLTAGVVWIAVGVSLTLVAVTWLSTVGPVFRAVAGLSVIAGFLISKYGFSRLIARNVERIRALAPQKPRVCIFAFQAVQSYFLVLLMMALGYALRHLPLPHKYTSAIYMIIGVALLKSGIDYVRASRRLAERNNE